MGRWRGVELTGVSLAEPRPAPGTVPGSGPLRLRPYRPADVARAHAAMQDRTMHAFLPLPDPYTEADAREFCCVVAPGKAAGGTGLELAMVGPDDLVVGGAGLTLPGPRDTGAEIGYSVHGAARGRGLAARATRLLAAWAFAHEVPRVEIRVAVGNLASHRSALAAGFTFEGVRRDEVLTPAGPTDGATFARTASDPGEPVPPWLPAMTGVGDDVLTLRPMVADDHPVLTAELRDPASMRWRVGPAAPDPAAAARRSAARAPLGWLVGPSTRVVVVDRARGEAAGVLELRRAGPPDVGEVGYVLLPQFRGRGLTARALRLLTAWTFATTDIARLELGADADNLASSAVARRAGFREEGRCTARLRRPDGTFGDEVRFGLTR